jgi:hypothetical protein
VQGVVQGDPMVAASIVFVAGCDEVGSPSKLNVASSNLVARFSCLPLSSLVSGALPLSTSRVTFLPLDPF